MDDIEQYYQIALSFYKEKRGKALQLSYHDNLKLIAYTKVVKNGAYSVQVDKQPLGYFDVIGNDRNEAWKQLGDMDRDSAMKSFLDIIKSNCPKFEPYLEAHLNNAKLALNDKSFTNENPIIYDSDKKFLDDEYKEYSIEQNNACTNKNPRARAEELLEHYRIYVEPQLLNYVAQCYPNDSTQGPRTALFAQLRRQYLAQINAAASNSTVVLNNGENFDGDHLNYHSRHLLNDSTTTTINTPSTMNPNSSEIRSVTAGTVNSCSYDETEELEEGNLPGTTDDLNDLETYEINEHISPASMWTRKDIKEFKCDVKNNHKECLIKISQGETVTIRVPTHANGSSLFWEYATEGYDIGFGIYFEWSVPLTDKISVHVSQEESDTEEGLDDDEDEEEFGREKCTTEINPPKILNGEENNNDVNTKIHHLRKNLDPESGLINHSSFNDKSIKETKFDNSNPNKEELGNYSSDLENGGAFSNKIDNIQMANNISSDLNIPVQNIPIDEIIPLERRDSHVHVCVGTHPYPGQGVYLLKFDNSYSLWRSKTLYYKIYYTK